MPRTKRTRENNNREQERRRKKKTYSGDDSDYEPKSTSEDDSEESEKTIQTKLISEDDSEESGPTIQNKGERERLNKRERSPSREAVSNSQEKKRFKANTARKVLDKSKVGGTKSLGKQKIDNSGDSIEFGDLYQIGEVEYKFIRKSESDSDIIYLTSEKDEFLYEYNTDTKVKKEHSLSKFHKIEALSGDDVKNAKAILLRGSTSEKEIELKEVNEIGLNAISKSLSKYVYGKQSLKALQEEDDTEINLGPDSNYGIILKRAVQAIRGKYGLEIDYVAAVQKEDPLVGTKARDHLNSVELQHPTQRWEAYKKDKNKNIRETAKLAAIHLMSNDKDLRNTIDDVKKSHHNGYSDSAIIEAYATAICAEGGNKNNEDLIRDLAEVRLRYSPITYESKVYLAANKRKPLNEIREWEHFNTLIHEALHSVEHPNFASFLETHIPPGLQGDIKEGIVDYLTSQIWDDVLRNLADPGRARKRTTPSDRDFNKPLQKPLEIKDDAKRIFDKEYFAYKRQVRTVTKLINKLNDGEKRLISAYFGGNLGAFLPKLINDTEDNLNTL